MRGQAQDVREVPTPREVLPRHAASPHLARQVAAVAAPRLRLDRRTFFAVGTTLAASTLLQAPRARCAVAELDFVSYLDCARTLRVGLVYSCALSHRNLDYCRK